MRISFDRLYNAIYTILNACIIYYKVFFAFTIAIPAAGFTVKIHPCARITYTLTYRCVEVIRNITRVGVFVFFFNVYMKLEWVYVMFTCRDGFEE